ncbi:MAG TPA: spermidine/putrescine ABC transporter substrate-binding protein [Rubrobacteraceae bacterium]|nr:spermidine/putrescine ABC transporter substrate-binding protein [Rubrobacteraceae bacterium]
MERNTSITRGRFLKVMGAGAVAGTTLSVLACQPNTNAQSSGGGGDGGGGKPKKINLYNWSDYVAKSTLPGFEKKTGIKVQQDFYGSNEELLAKLQAGGTGYDVIVPSDYMVSIMRKSEVIEKLDKSKIPNFKNLDPDFKGLPYDPNNDYSMTYQWGTTGILYDPEVVEEEVTGWDAMWDEKYSGKIGMLNDVRETFGASLKRLGYSLNSTDKGELDEAQSELEKQKPLLRGYFGSPEGGDLVVGGDLALAHVFSGDGFSAIAENDKLVYIIPDQGATRWTDNMAIPKGAPNPDVGHQFINYILDPKVGADLSNYTYYGCPNKASMPMIDKAAKNDPAIYPPPKVFERLEVIKDLGSATKDYERRFTEVKSG